jgi:hypothetical protein
MSQGGRSKLGRVALGLAALGLVAVLIGVGLLLWLRWPGQSIPSEPPPDVQASPRGWQIRYNATLSLAVRGSKKVRLDLLQEMLDENIQLKNFRLKTPGGTRDVPDEAGARRTVLNTLKAIAEWHKKLDVAKAYTSDEDKKDLEKVYAAIDRLADKSTNPVLRTEAERTRILLKRS